jgi:Domain of unknown function (DUF4279)
MTTQFLVSFLLSDFDQNPEEITHLLGIKPSLTWKRGDLIHPKATIIREFNGWELKGNLNDEDLETQLSTLIEELKTGWRGLIELKDNNCYAQLSIIINVCDGNIPAVSFTPEIVKNLAEINAAIDIDLYF